MKKLTAIFLALVMLSALTACGSKPAAENEITELVKEGYCFTTTTYDETEWRGIFMKDDSYDVVYKVTADMTAKQYEKYSAIGWDDEKAEEKQLAILGELTNVVVTDITDMIPTQAELDAYVGKTIGDMEDEGFENTGWTGEPGEGYELYYDGPVYYCKVSTVEEVDDMDNYSTNDIRALEIASVEFLGISSYILDQ